MRAPHVPDDLLRAADVPPVAAPVPALLGFAHGYHAYKVAGSLQRVGAIAVDLHDRWTADGADPRAVLDEPVGRLRIALFHTARAIDHAGADRAATTAETETWLRVLVRSIAAAVSGRADRDVAPRGRADGHGDPRGGSSDVVT